MFYIRPVAVEIHAEDGARPSDPASLVDNFFVLFPISSILSSTISSMFFNFLVDNFLVENFAIAFYFSLYINIHI